MNIENKIIYVLCAAAFCAAPSLNAAVYAEYAEGVDYCAPRAVVVSAEPAPQKVGLIRGAKMFVGSVARLVGDTVGDIAYRASEGVNSCNIAPARVLPSRGGVVVVERPVAVKEAVELRPKSVSGAELFAQIMSDDFAENFGGDFLSLDVRSYGCSNGIYHGDISATFHDSAKNCDYIVRARAHSGDLSTLKWILREQIKAAKFRVANSL